MGASPTTEAALTPHPTRKPPSVRAVEIGVVVVVTALVAGGAYAAARAISGRMTPRPPAETGTMSSPHSDDTSASTPATPSAATSETAAKPRAEATPSSSPAIAPGSLGTIAWQPSHQNDTGANSWHEYIICGDIVDRVVKALPEYEHVKAWDTKHGLTGSNRYEPKPTNTKAFDAELAIANAAHADIFISVHNDGAAPSGVLGISSGDAKSKALVTALVAALSKRTGLPSRGVRDVRLYSLESDKNHAPVRILLEIGDNAADRAFLEDPANRQLIAETLAEALRDYR